MKLLGWMHRKLRQNSIEPFKEFTSGNLCFYLSEQQSQTNQQCYPKPSYDSAHSWQPQGKVQKLAGELKSKSVEEVFEEESSFMISNDFDGFLTIGTLGSEPIITEPPTPTFPMPFEKNTEVTENELKLIKDELEKFLDAETEEEEVCNETSGRSSYASTITLSGKQIKGADTEDYGDMVVCPLQEYLFGSSIELSKTCVEGKKEKTSLGQLFKLNNTAYEHSTEKSETKKNQAKGVHAVHFMKNMLKKLHSSSRNSLPSDGGEVAASASTNSKLHKVLRMFHKKIHPERSTAEKNSTKSDNYNTKNTSYNGGYDNGNLTLHDKDNRKSLHKAMLKKGPTNRNPTYNGLSNSHSTQNRERWIKTDADYLVLEL